MVERIERYFQHSDERGSIEGIVNIGEWREINLISSAGGTVRGHHYHKRTDEMFLILDGEVEVLVQEVRDGRLTGEPRIETVRTGDAFVVRPMQYHVFTLRVPSRWINMLSRSIDPNDPDIHRIDG